MFEIDVQKQFVLQHAGVVRQAGETRRTETRVVGQTEPQRIQHGHDEEGSHADQPGRDAEIPREGLLPLQAEALRPAAALRAVLFLRCEVAHQLSCCMTAP